MAGSKTLPSKNFSTPREVDVGIWDADLETGYISWSDRCHAMFGIPPGTPITAEDFFAHVHPEDLGQARAAVDRSLDPQIRAEHALELRVIGRDDGVERWLSIRGEVMFSPDGHAQRFLGAVVNITHRKRAELHLRLLVNELNHRVKNTLATVQSITRQTAKGATSIPAFRTSLEARLMSLSGTHNLLTRGSWERAPLRDLLSQEAAPHAADQVTLQGPDIQVEPRQALALGMIFHELATNAAKYGALSAAGGRARGRGDAMTVRSR